MGVEERVKQGRLPCFVVGLVAATGED